MTGFTDLPVEIIRHIASHTSYESIFSLSCVSNQLWMVCHDWTIFKDMLNHKNPKAYKFIRQSKEAKASTWKDFALADFWASTATLDTPDYLTWAPQMLALHHSSSNTTNISNLLKGISRKPLVDARAYAFCFAARALSFELPPSGSTDSFHSSIGNEYCVISCVTDWSCRALDSSVSKISAMGPLWNEEKLMNDREWPVERHQMHAVALKALGFLSVELKSAIARGQALTTQTTQPCGQNNLRGTEFEIPTCAQDIPFASFMELPVPFSSDATSRFNACHLLKMTTKSFIEDGEWSGMEFGSRLDPRQAPRVVGIQAFTLLVGPEDSNSDIIQLESSSLFGLQAQGQLQMSLKKSTGITLIAMQSDVNLHPIHWQGILTPFGFVGTTTLSPGNWFWLWKKNWSGILRPKYDLTKAWGVNMQMVQQAVARL